MSELTKEWEADLVALHERIADCFHRLEPRKRALGYLKGLLSLCERKNGWQLAQQSGALNPDGVQRLLNQAGWESEQVAGNEGFASIGSETPRRPSRRLDRR